MRPVASRPGRKSDRADLGSSTIQTRGRTSIDRRAIWAPAAHVEGPDVGRPDHECSRLPPRVGTRVPPRRPGLRRLQGRRDGVKTRALHRPPSSCMASVLHPDSRRKTYVARAGASHKRLKQLSWATVAPTDEGSQCLETDRRLDVTGGEV